MAHYVDGRPSAAFFCETRSVTKMDPFVFEYFGEQRYGRTKYVFY